MLNSYLLLFIVGVPFKSQDSVGELSPFETWYCGFKVEEA